MIQNYNTQKPFLAEAPTASRICFYQGIIFVNNAEDTKYREICKDVYQIFGGDVKILRSIGNMPQLLHLIIIYQLTRFIMKMTWNIKRILIIYYSWLLSRSTFSSWNQIYVVDVYRVTINHNSSPNKWGCVGGELYKSYIITCWIKVYLSGINPYAEGSVYEIWQACSTVF